MAKKNKKYQIIYADPPWRYRNRQFSPASGWSKGVGSHYNTMSIEEIKSLNVNDIADHNGCLLFMWTSSPHLNEAIDVLEAWGFDYITVGFIWDKQRLNPGYYTISQCELCLIGKIKKIPQPRGARNIRQLVSVKRSRHSEKPGVIRERITQMFPRQNKIELFARKPFIPSPGFYLTTTQIKKAKQWDWWGNEVIAQVDRQRKEAAMKQGKIIPQQYPFHLQKTIDRLRAMMENKK